MPGKKKKVEQTCGRQQSTSPKKDVTTCVHTLLTGRSSNRSSNHHQLKASTVSPPGGRPSNMLTRSFSHASRAATRVSAEVADRSLVLHSCREVRAGGRKHTGSEEWRCKVSRNAASYSWL
jgi:hypothetical protein